MRSLAIGRRASPQCWGVTAGKARYNSSSGRGVTAGKVGHNSSLSKKRERKVKMLADFNALDEGSIQFFWIF